MSETNSLFELPLDIVLRIFRYLNPKDLRTLMLTCKSLCDLIISDNALWKTKCDADFVIFDNSENRHVSSFWYHRYRISFNWRKGVFRHQVINHNKEKFMPWLKFFQSRCLLLALGSEIGCLGVNPKGIPDSRNFHWKLHVPIVRRRDIRTNDITRFIVKNDKLVCGNCDGGTAVYQWDNITKRPYCIQHIQNCHQQGTVEVSAVELGGTEPGYFFTASHQSPEVKMWRTEKDSSRRSTTECFKEYKFKNALGGKCLSVDKADEKLAVGLDGNNRPLVIDIESGSHLVNTENTKNPFEVIRDIHWYNSHTIFYSTHTGSVQFWDTRVGGVVYKKLDTFQAALYCARSDGAHALLTGSAQNARCALHDLRMTRDFVQIYFVQTRSASPVYCLDFDSSKLIAAADRTVAVLDYDVPMPARKNKIKDYTFAFNDRPPIESNFGRLQILE